MNKLPLLILILLLANNCSIKKKQAFWGNDEPKNDEIPNIETSLTKKIKKEQEFNAGLEIKNSNGKFSKASSNNQNNIGELSYEGSLEKIGAHNFSKFDDFEYVDAQPIFYNDNVIFYDNKGAITLYDQNQKIVWKKNFYTKSEKKN